jgi:hypothetical protein
MIEVLPNSFIFEKHNAMSPELCQEIISMFEAEPEAHKQGEIIGEGSGVVDLDIKVSTDLFINKENGPDWLRIDESIFWSLNEAATEMSAKFDSLQEGFRAGFGDDGYKIQRTEKDGFYGYHEDSNMYNCNRFMVAIWYLNDGFKGGETEFQYQQVKIKPEAGKLVVFPPWWTHRHRGCPVEYGTKYITTTWLNYT